MKGTIDCTHMRPVSVNAMYATAGGCPRNATRRVLTKKAREWKEYIAEVVAYEIGQGRIKRKGPPTKFKITLRFTFPDDKRKRDPSNYTKAIYDALTGVIWEDDSQIFQEAISKTVGSGWGIEIEWVELEDK